MRSPEEYFEPDELEVFRIVDGAEIPAYDEGPDPFDDSLTAVEFSDADTAATERNDYREAVIDNLARDILATGIPFSWEELSRMETKMMIYHTPRFGSLDSNTYCNLRDVFKALRTMSEAVPA